MYRISKQLKRIAYSILVAFMLGISNAMADENKIENKTFQVEQEITPDPDEDELWFFNP